MAMMFTLALQTVSLSLTVVPQWPATYDMGKSTIFMPCNDSGFLSPEISAKWGVADFDWSNTKGLWTRGKPMDCEEKLVEQAALVKSVNPGAKVWVYRNLVKALPWYTSVREKMLDPQYAGFFLKFKKGGSLPNNTYHVPACTASTVGGPTKCSEFYHDQEQTPKNGEPSINGTNGWKIYNEFNGVSSQSPCALTNTSDACLVWSTTLNASNFKTWESCQKEADKAMLVNSKIRLFTWWPLNLKNKEAPPGGYCWFSHALIEGHSGPENGHVMGYKGPADDEPPVTNNYNTCDGDCDCGDGLPCGEYLWDHRNGSMVRNFLVNEFVLGNRTGLGSAMVDGFYFDDGWTNKPSKVPSWAPPNYKQCDMWKTGGATEEDYYCIEDMGLTQDDVNLMTSEHTTTMTDVYAAVVANKGFAWPLLTGRAASLDLSDPRPPPKCKSFMRKWCQTGQENNTLMFEFTRKLFSDAFPLPYVTEDVAQFLLVRQKYAYIGYSWMGCIQPSGFVHGNSTKGYFRPSEVDVDYGVPTENFCSETAADSGIFKRKWSKADVTMNCNTYTATIDMTTTPTTIDIV